MLKGEPRQVAGQRGQQGLTRGSAAHGPTWGLSGRAGSRRHSLMVPYGWNSFLKSCREAHCNAA
jgi:hypothetical protein